MLEALQNIPFSEINWPPVIGAVFGFGLLTLGLISREKGESVRRRRLSGSSAIEETPADVGILNGDGSDVCGLLKAFVPRENAERHTITRRLRQAGIKDQNMVWVFYLAKTVLALVFPALYAVFLVLPQLLSSGGSFADLLSSPATAQNLMLVALSVLVGFYAPEFWLRSRIAARQQKIWENLPISLDLLQISIGAGIGFDAALIRVANEISDIAPEIAEEFMMAELEIQAGKDRRKAFADMGDRTGVEEMRAFANTVIQAAEYGTNLSSALNAFAEEMRKDREYKAQEKANKLPVKMSGLVAAFMMPVLLLMTLGPIAVMWLGS